jgi:hypothetical protein
MIEPITLLLFSFAGFGKIWVFENSPNDCTDHDGLFTTEDIRDEAGAQGSEP